MQGGLSPFVGLFGSEENISNFVDLEGRADDARLIQQLGRIGQARKIKASPGTQEQSHLSRQLLLTFDPITIDGGLQRLDTSMAELGLSEPTQPSPKLVVLQQPHTAMGQRLSHTRCLLIDVTTRPGMLRVEASFPSRTWRVGMHRG